MPDDVIEVWIIEDEPNVRESYVAAAEALGWAAIGFGPEVPADLPGTVPSLVVFDYGLDGLNPSSRKASVLRERWARALGAKRRRRCFVLTGDGSAIVQDWVQQQQMAGLLTKPMDMERLPRLIQRLDEDPAQPVAITASGVLIEAPSQSSMVDCASSFADDVPHRWEEWFDTLAPATAILDAQERLVVQNQASASVQMFDGDRRGAMIREPFRRAWRWLLAEVMPSAGIGPDTSRSAHRWEWDHEASQWIEWRLNRLGDGANLHYWLTRIWHSLPAMQGPLLMSRDVGLHAYMEALARTIADQWGISRLRLYLVDELSNGYSGQPGPKASHRIMPLMQFGGGLVDGDDSAWRREEFTLEGMVLTRDILRAPHRRAQLLMVDAAVMGRVEFGSTRQCGMLLVSKPFSDGAPIRPYALLAFDRRIDHLYPIDGHDPVYRFAHRAARFAPGALDQDDLNRMQGLLGVVHDEILARLESLEQKRMTQWEWHVSACLSRSPGKPERPEACPAAANGRTPKQVAAEQIRQAFADIVAAWEALESDPWRGATPEGCSGDRTSGNDECGALGASLGMPLSDLYVMDQMTEDAFRVELGYEPGFLFRLHRGNRQAWHISEPISHVTFCGDCQAYVIQDFDAWRTMQCNDGAFDSTRILERRAIERAMDPATVRDELERVRAWAGVRIPRGDRESWVLVAVSPIVNGWTGQRVEWLNALGRRLAVVLRWWEAECQRDWFREAISHEMHRPIQRMDGVTKSLRELLPPMTQPIADSILALVHHQRHMIEDMKLLNNTDFAREVTGRSGGASLPVAIAALDWIFQENPKLLERPRVEDLPTCFLNAPQAVLNHVLANLLLNAATHARGPMSTFPARVAAAVDAHYAVLKITVANTVEHALDHRDRRTIFLPYGRGRGASAAGTGVGLAVVRVLCERSGTRCETYDNKPSFSERSAAREAGHLDDWMWQVFQLTMPLRVEVQSLASREAA